MSRTGRSDSCSERGKAAKSTRGAKPRRVAPRNSKNPPWNVGSLSQGKTIVLASGRRLVEEDRLPQFRVEVREVLAGDHFG